MHQITTQFCEKHNIKPKDLFSYTPDPKRNALMKKLIKIFRKHKWSYAQIGREVGRDKSRVYRLVK